jgi:DNA-directed RNA polymerase specialized sigma24 family protein
MKNKDKKIVDAYIKKHGDKLNPKKLEEYARKKGIHINVMKEIEHRKMKKRLLDDLGLPDNLDMEKEENQLKVQAAIDALSPEKKAEFMKQVD